MDTSLKEIIKSKIIFYQSGKDYNECYWELKDGVGVDVSESENESPALQYAVIENKSVCAFLLNEQYDNVTIPDSIKTNEQFFTVKYVFLRCQKWEVKLPETIEVVIIDRELSRNTDFNQKHEFGNSKNSSFEVSPQNPYFCSIDGSLYSKDMHVLYHYNSEHTLDENLKEIVSEAIYYPGPSLQLPQGIKDLKTNAIVGDFREIVFKGKLSNIEGELDWVHYEKKTVVKINGLLRDLTESSRTKLNQWRKSRLGRKIVFAAPIPIQYPIPESGYIRLTGVIEDNHKGCDNNRLDYNKDYKEVVLNASLGSYIDNPKGDIMISIEDEMMVNLFEPVKGSHIKFISKDDNSKEGINYIDVYEESERIRQLIADVQH